MRTYISGSHRFVAPWSDYKSLCLYKWFPFLFFPVCVHRRSYPSLANANSLWPLSGNLGCVVEPSLRSLGLALPAGRSAAQIGKRNQGNLQPNPPITLLVRALIAVAVDKWPHLPSSQPPHTVTGVCETFFRTPVCVIVSVSVWQNRISARQLVSFCDKKWRLCLYLYMHIIIWSVLWLFLF